MTTSGTFTFGMTAGEVIMQAYRRLGIPRSQLDQEKLLDAQNELNLLLIAWANKGPNLWAVDQLSITLIQGQASYTVDPSTIMIMDARVNLNGIDRVVEGISRSEYMAFANKATQAPPTVYWFDRLIAPTVTIWPVPDGNGPYTLYLNRFRYSQDAYLVNGQSIELPNRFLDACIWGLAERLAWTYNPAMQQQAEARYAASYEDTIAQDVENADLEIKLDMSRYWP